MEARSHQKRRRAAIQSQRQAPGTRLCVDFTVRWNAAFGVNAALCLPPPCSCVPQVDQTNWGRYRPMGRRVEVGDVDVDVDPPPIEPVFSILELPGMRD